MSPTNNDSTTKLLNCLLTALSAIDHAALGMIELRSREKTYNEVTSGDYDFAIDPDDLKEILKLFLCACLQNGVHLEIKIASVNKYVLYLISNKRKIVLELWHKIEMFSPKGTSEQFELSGKALITALRGASKAKAEAVKAAIYLTHLYYKNKDVTQPLQQKRLRDFYAALDEPSSSYKVALKIVIEKLLPGSKDNLQLALATANVVAQKSLRSQGINVRPRRFAALRQRWHRRRSLIGSIVPVLGPDGSGKTYFCEHLVSDDPLTRRHQPYKMFFRCYDYKFLLRMMKLFFKNDKTNQIDERLSLYVIMKATFVSIIRGRQMKREGKILLIDRYGWDYLIKGLRLRQNPPSRMKLYHFWRNLIPRPSKCIILFAPAETISSRKIDLTPEMISFVYDEYIDLITAGRALNCFFCNTELDHAAAGIDLNAFLRRT